MHDFAEKNQGVAVVGWSCRLPGANSVSELWSLLSEGRCAISRVPADRFSLDHFSHPRRQERGRTYTWAAGVLDDIWGFDPAIFGISPREAQQMDPQQRILLQLTWEALEDAGIPPSSVAGKGVGVYVGASQTEYAQPFFGDPAIGDAHFATGNSLAVLSNRISYIFDTHGPSMTIDTACSSSLVALHEACEALRSGRIETAIVGGINIIAAPTSFIFFSQAAMLSPTGLCRAFSGDADGFVRAEGAAVLILRRIRQARNDGNPVRGVIAASDVNSDGRTSGIALPSADAQLRLLRTLYSQANIDPTQLAFIEAHGTGTPAGDPIEAYAIGHGLARHRTAPLPIGSIKTNIGHLEPASGLAGILKALLALEHGVLPPTINYTRPNPNIDLDELNLAICREPMLLSDTPHQYAGVNSFGFGGTNAHVVLERGRSSDRAPRSASSGSAAYTILSAQNKPALTALASKYIDRIVGLSSEATAVVAAAAAHRRDRLASRLVVTSTRHDVVTSALEAYVADNNHPALTFGEAIGSDLPIAFVYSGNGGQWVGMGCSAYRHNAAFRSRFDETSHAFERLAGWSLTGALFDEKLTDRIELTSVAQPLIFAIQVSATAALRARGLSPMVALGHSVGEIAAAEAAEVFDLPTAVRVVYCRSRHQELVRHAGRMVAVLSSAEAVEALASQLGEVEIAAYNSPRALTIAGPVDALAQFTRLAKRNGFACLDLNLDYPFHTEMMAPVEAPLLADLTELRLQDGTIPFVSTVDGVFRSGIALDAHYWWRNVRQPVQFTAAVREAAKLGSRCFLEIGPRGLLGKHIADSLSEDFGAISALCVLERDAADDDPFERAVAKALVAGAKIDLEAVAGPDPGGHVALPSYPWQQKPFRYAPTTEALGWFNSEHHPLSGARYAVDALEWHAFIDTAVLPELADHRVGGQIILPGTAFVEIALSVARQWLRTEDVRLAHCEILAPLDLTSGETREVLSRVSSGSQTIEIQSRPRLSAASWVTHVRAKVVHGTGGAPAQGLAIPSGGETVSGDTVYRIADACGLHYGPAFSVMETACLHDDNLISVRLSPTKTKHAFLLDPLRLDCCAHAVILLFPGLRAEERSVAYVPVRLDEVTLYRPGSIPAAALIEVKATSERSILTDMSVFSADGDVIAILRGIRSQAIPVRRNCSLESCAFVERSTALGNVLLKETGVEARVSDVAAAARRLGLISDEHPATSEATRMIEGWATMAAFEIASAVADNDVVDPDLLVNERHWTAGMRSWLIALLERLEAAQLAEQSNGVWILVKDPLLPSSTSIVRTLAAEHPDRVAELMLAAETTAFAERLARRTGAPDEGAQLSALARDFYDLANRSRHDAAEVLLKLVRATEGLWPNGRALRVLLIGFSPLALELTRLKEAEVNVTVLECDRRQFERAELAVDRSNRVRVIDQLNNEVGAFDAVIAAEAIYRLPSAVTMSELFGALAPSGIFAAVEPRPSLFRDLVFGIRGQWGDMPDYRSPRSASEWTAELQQANFVELSVLDVTTGADRTHLIVCKSASVDQSDPEPASDLTAPVIRHADTAGASKLATLLTERLGAWGSRIDHASGQGENDKPSVVVYAPPSQDQLGDPLGSLSRRCLEIKACAERIGSARVTLWLVFEGALPNEGRELRPVETGAWAFARTLANEFAQLDVRKIDVAPGVSPDVAVERIMTIVRSATNETELQIEKETVRAVRVESIGAKARDSRPVAAARLERGATAGQRLVWQPIERRPPAPDEVEIAVAATGLNFRDVMYMLGLLPEDILEGGLTGPSLGLECAGTVVATGSAVKAFDIGDRVVAFAPSAFSTHLSVSAAQAMKIPDTMTLEAAATIPVAFLTAYYSLVSLANLRHDEWLLVHGGAGAVGMAAIQIAQARGAKIIATAGSPPKRDVLRALGVAHVLDSRSTRFVDEVREITGSGVNVVLNSLAGEAMERSIACLSAFGRFVELGKRDFVANTHIGLRPLRKNLSYFAVDVDQLMVGRPEIGHETFSTIWSKFADGSFTPLPHCTFSGAEVAGAFQLMQQSGHIGKIVVHPPALDAIRTPRQKFVVDPTRAHLVTGGFGGFGLATARWLADRGARHLVLVGRRGAESAEAQDLIAELSLRGIVVLAEKCDIADAGAVESLFAKIRCAMPRLAGVIHSAMVLDDAIIGNLDAARLDRVLAPKVRGATNLDRATRDLELDYFVLYSSVTTLIGNPGQGNYVAANAFMEGLARRRRQEGLPALAIGWGPISDVGIVARTEKLQSNLNKVGTRGMTAREALELMAQALGEASDLVDEGVITIAPYDSALRSDLLPVLKSPTYSGLIGRHHGESGLGDNIDLRALLKTNDIDAVRQTVADVVVAELARVLHFREEDVGRARPLADLGLDSLMALELAMNLEERFGIQFKLGGSSANLTVTSVTNEIIAQVNLDDGTRGDATAIVMAEQHLENVGKEEVELLTALIESERPKTESVQS